MCFLFVACQILFRCLMFVKLNGIKIFNRMSVTLPNSEDMSMLKSNSKVNCEKSSLKENHYMHNAKMKPMLSFSVQLYEDDLSRINVKNLVRFCNEELIYYVLYILVIGLNSILL